MRPKPDVIVVGGEGYLGTGVVRQLRQQGRNVRTIDCRAMEDGDGEDLRLFDPTGFDPCDVVWLATLHDLPETMRDPAWEPIYEDIMVKQPLAWLQAGHRLTYVSSARAVTHKQTLYGATKACMEAALVGGRFPAAWRVVRPGTVWGGFDQVPSPRMRIHTVINHWLSHGRTLPYASTAQFFHTQYDRAVVEIARRFNTRDVNAITNIFDGRVSGERIVSGDHALGEIEVKLEEQKFETAKRDGRVDLESPHPMVKYAEFYGIGESNE